MEGEVTLEEPDEHKSTALRQQVEGSVHRGRVARGIEDERGELTAHGLSDRLHGVVAGLQDVDAGPPGREGTPAFAQIRDQWPLTSGKQMRRHRKADGTRADHEDAVSGHRCASLHGVPADGERLHQGELVDRQARGDMQRRARQQETFAHTAVHVCAQDSQRGAGVVEAPPTGVA